MITPSSSGGRTPSSNRWMAICIMVLEKGTAYFFAWITMNAFSAASGRTSTLSPFSLAPEKQNDQNAKDIKQIGLDAPLLENAKPGRKSDRPAADRNYGL